MRKRYASQMNTSAKMRARSLLSLARDLRLPQIGTRLFLLLVLASGTLLLLVRLDDMYLWEDEAETALVAKNLSSYGLPLGFDGRNMVYQTELRSQSFNQDYLWVWHSWMQFALTALSFKVIGTNTFAARLPFVLVALITIWFFHGFVLRWLGDRRTARLATVMLLLCVPFLLLARQCRYYALSAFFTLTTLDAYLHLRKGNPLGLPYFVLSGTLYYHGHHAAFFPTMAALGAHLLLNWRLPRQTWLRLIAGFGLVAAFSLPWAYYMRVWTHVKSFEPLLSFSHLMQYLLYITVWIFPLVLAVLLFVAWLRRETARPSEGRPKRRVALSRPQALLCELAGLVIVVNLASMSSSPFFDAVHFRHVTHLIPLFLAMLAIVVIVVVDISAVVGSALALILVVLNVLHILPYSLPGIRDFRWSSLRPGVLTLVMLDNLWAKAHRLRSELLMYAHELTNSYEGPTEGLVRYLSEHAQPDDVVLANYEELPLMFYTNLRIIGGLQGEGVVAGVQPDWIVDRRHGPYRESIAAIVRSGHYERIQLPYADLHWENRPEPGIHHYLTVRDPPYLTLHRLIKDGHD